VTTLNPGQARRLPQVPAEAGWRVRGASIQGYAHLRDGSPCQDAYRHLAVPDALPEYDVHVLAVADGAGSRPRSAEGAVLAVGMATQLLRTQVAGFGVPTAASAWHDLLRTAYLELVGDFRRAVASVAGAASVGEFATTLTLVVLAHPWLGVVSIGDGFVVVRTHDGGDPQFHLVSVALPVSEYANETVFLTSQAAKEAAQLACLWDPAVSGVMIATDGLAQAALSYTQGLPRRPNRSFAERLLLFVDDPGSDVAELPRLLLGDQLIRLSADDKTLLVAVRT
jgi:Protein phosphatase 2C